MIDCRLTETECRLANVEFKLAEVECWLAWVEFGLIEIKWCEITSVRRDNTRTNKIIQMKLLENVALKRRDH